MIEMLERLKELVHCTPSCNSRWRDGHPCDCEAKDAQMLIQDLIDKARRYDG